MQNTKAVKFEEGVAFFSGEDRYLVPGQKVRIGTKMRGRVDWDVEDYKVVYQDEVTGSIVVRGDATNGITALSRTSMLARGVVAVEYYGIEVDGQMVFPGDVVVVRTNTDAFDTTFICDEGRDDLVRVMRPETRVVGTVPYDSIELKNADVVEIGEWVMIDGEPYIVAMVGVDEWAMISPKSGNRFFDREEVDIILSGGGRGAIPKQTLLDQTDKIGAKVEFCGKIEIFQCEVNDE